MDQILIIIFDLKYKVPYSQHYILTSAFYNPNLLAII